MRNAAAPLQRVTIYREGDMWVCDVVNDPSAAETRRLFETTALPMPYRATVAEATVRERLAIINPGITITRGIDQ